MEFQLRIVDILVRGRRVFGRLFDFLILAVTSSIGLERGVGHLYSSLIELLFVFYGVNFMVH